MSSLPSQTQGTRNEEEKENGKAHVHDVILATLAFALFASLKYQSMTPPHFKTFDGERGGKKTLTRCEVNPVVVSSGSCFY